MPPSPAPSNIRAYVRWREPNVYAGEEIECLITFKNVARVPGKNKEQEGQKSQPPNGYPRDQRRQSYATSAAESRRSSLAPSNAASNRVPSATASTKESPQLRGHRPSLSLNVGRVPSRGGPQSAPVAPKAPYSALQGHSRSLSIMSLGSDKTNLGTVPEQGGPVKRPGKIHARSASLQSVSRPPPTSPYTGPAPPRQPSPLFESSTPPALAEGHSEQLPIRPTKRRPGTVSAGHTPQLARQNSTRRPSPGSVFTPTFQFPGPQRVKSPPPQIERPKLSRSPSSMQSEQKRASSPKPPEGWTGPLSNLHPITRVMSETSTAGTPRTSSEFYSISNHSDETIASEMRPAPTSNSRLAPSAPTSRHTSKPKSNGRHHNLSPETLMMGYAQTMGYFILDGSLVNAAPFEEVKRKGVQGGGGVIGVDRAKTSSGMFGGFSWGNIGESLSLGGLLGGEENSSIARMKATAGSKSIPLLSTPQNLLFVDLNLAPGESKSFAYRFSLPRGLPPTHKGRAIKVEYHLLLGVQRPERQTVRHLEIPFRILGSYNGRGEGLGHDLMAPYILLQDAARSRSVTAGGLTAGGLPAFPMKETEKQVPKQGLEDFLRYTERLLEQPKDTHHALVSPTSPATPTLSRKISTADQVPSTVKEAIDLAILRANFVDPSSKQRESENASANRFNIARAGQPVAVLTLLRPAYRLGESVIGTVDFTAPPPDAAGVPAQAPTYSMLAELESAEGVDPSLALRSSTSIHRVTRKAYASVRENTLFSRQISFSLTIPSSATPSFETTGVSLVWRLRVEFTTQRQVQGLGLGNEGEEDGSEMLEELGTDERGTILIAKERLGADTFEISVPLKVFGAAGVEGMGDEVRGLEV